MGKAKTKRWIAEYISEVNVSKDSSMGWNASNDTRSQIKIYFNTKEKAIEWALKNNYQFYVVEPHKRKIKPKAYAMNFDINRKEPWTH